MNDAITRKGLSLGLLCLGLLISAIAGCGGLSAADQHATAVVIKATKEAKVAAKQATHDTVAAEARQTYAAEQAAYLPNKVATAAAQEQTRSATDYHHIFVHATAQMTADQKHFETFYADVRKRPYGEIRDHPELYQGKRVFWRCVIADFLGPDPTYPQDKDIGCWEYTDTYDGGTGDGEVLLNVAPALDTSTMHKGDDISVLGWVSEPAKGTNSLGGPVTVPEVVPYYLGDRGPIPTPTP